MEVAGLVLGVLPLVLGALESSQYIISQHSEWSRELSTLDANLIREVHRLRDLLDKTHQLCGLETGRNLMYSDASPEALERIDILQSTLQSRCRQYVGLAHSLRRQVGSQTCREAIKESAQKCHTVVFWTSHKGKDPAFWKLQKWITHSAEQGLLSLRIQVPATISKPSPTTLVASWIVMILAVFTYYETHSKHKYRKLILFGSSVAAFVIGIVEQSSMNNILLTNVPCCLALATILDLLVHKSIEFRSRIADARRSSWQPGLRDARDVKILL